MKRLLSMSAAALVAAALALAAAASAQVVSAKPAPPAASDPASTSIFDALLAIERAAASNPAAAQAATLSYDTAIQQYNSGDQTRARMSALQALEQTAQAPLPAPELNQPDIPQQSFLTMPFVVTDRRADAEAYVGLARRALALCGAPGAPIPAAVTQQYIAGADDLLNGRTFAAKAAAKIVIDQCAAAGQAYAAQLQAMPAPSMTPMATESYNPLPIATLGPDPALQSTPVPEAMPTTTPVPPARHGFRL
jgi:hypothetical protein